MQLYGNYFNYNGTSSQTQTYKLIFANVETKENTDLSSKTETISMFNKRNKRLYYISTSFDEECVSFDVEIMTDDGQLLTDNDQSAIKKWLFYQPGFKKLYSVDCGTNTQDTYYVNCQFTNPSVLYGNGGIVGYKATMECDSPFCMKDKTSNTITSFSSNISITVDSEPKEYIYPKVVFTTGGSAGNVQIRNMTDDSSRITKFENLPANTEITMVGSTNYITTGYYNYFTNKNFVRFLDGANSINVTGSVASMRFEWTDVRYIL